MAHASNIGAASAYLASWDGSSGRRGRRRWRPCATRTRLAPRPSIRLSGAPQNRGLPLDSQRTKDTRWRRQPTTARVTAVRWPLKPGLTSIRARRAATVLFAPSRALVRDRAASRFQGRKRRRPSIRLHVDPAEQIRIPPSLSLLQDLWRAHLCRGKRRNVLRRLDRCAGRYRARGRQTR